MNRNLRNTLIVSFTAAAAFAAWQAWNDYLREQAQPRVKIIDTRTDRTMPVNGWFTGKTPGGDRPASLEADPATTAPSNGSGQHTDYRIYADLSDCRVLLESRENYTRFLQEPASGIKKYEYLEAAIFNYHHQKEFSEQLGLTTTQARQMMATHARPAIAEWMRQIESSPDDPAGNLRQIDKILRAFWYASYNFADSRKTEEFLGISLAGLTARKYQLNEPALRQKLQEFANFSGSLTLGTDGARQYLSMYAEFRDFNPFDKDNWSVDGERVSDTPHFREVVMKNTGMTIEQARTFFQRAYTLSRQQEQYDASEQKARENEFNKNERKYTDIVRKELRQCQLKIG